MSKSKEIIRASRVFLVPRGRATKSSDEGWSLSFRFLNGIRRTVLENSAHQCQVTECQIEETVLALVKEGYVILEERKNED